MSETFSLKLSNRPNKKPLRSLPPTLEITPTTTVEDLKQSIAKATRITDYNRIAIFEPADGDKKAKVLKDRRRKLGEEVNVMRAGEVLVGDLGPQIQWRTVFLIEYIGPIIIHAFILLFRPFIYSSPTTSVTPNLDNTSTLPALSASQSSAAIMIILHFLKREYETLFIHKFSSNTMPFFNVWKNSAHYWGLAGINIAYWVYAPNANAATTGGLSDLALWLGWACYLIGEAANLNAHLVLSNLRSPGGTERGIPKGLGFALVTCPNYMFETLAWIGILLVSRSTGTLLFVAIAVAQMQIWAEGKEKALRKEFGDKYKSKIWPMLPGVPFLASSGREKKVQ